MDNETKGYLYDDLKKENERLVAKVAQLEQKLEVAEKQLETAHFWWDFHGKEHKRLFERLYGIKLQG